MQDAANANTGAPPPRTTLLDRAVIVMNAIGSLWVLALVILIDIDAGGRTLFNMPIAGMIEFVAVSLAVIVFCQLADTIRLGKLTRSDTFIARMAGGAQGGRAIAAGFELLGAIVMALIVVGTVPLMLQSYERGYFIGVRGVFTFPDWPVKAIVVIGATAALLCFLVRVRRLWLGLPTNLGAEAHEAGE
ncbi:MAG: TRAP transporter small permease subunit [Pseudolabrys sp.]|nr:TRAP transporter small permease subunit [Pseudolabrys sp.]